MFTKQPHIYVGRDNDSHIVSPIHWYDEHTRPKPSICRHCEQNASTLFEKTSEEITDQHSSNSLTEQCNLNMHGYIERTTMMETGLSSANYQINRYKACSSEHALTRTTENLRCHQSRFQTIHHTCSHTDSPIYISTNNTGQKI